MLWINLSHHLPTTFPQFFSQKVPTTASLQWQQMESETLFTILFSKLKPSKKLQACYKSSFQLAKFEFVSVGRGRKLKSCSFFGLTLVICKKNKRKYQTAKLRTTPIPSCVFQTICILWQNSNFCIMYSKTIKEGGSGKRSTAEVSFQES